MIDEMAEFSREDFEYILRWLKLNKEDLLFALQTRKNKMEEKK